MKFGWEMATLINERVSHDPKEGTEEFKKPTWTPHGCNVWFVIN